MATQYCSFVVQNTFAVLVLVLAWTQSSLATDSIPVALFVDSECDYASPVNPNVSVPLNTCIVTPGAWAIEASSLACGDGSLVRMLTYGSGACGGQGYYGFLNECIEEYPDPVAGFVMYCGAKEQLQITSTTKIAVATNILSVTTGTATATMTSGSSSTSTSSGGSDTTDGSSMVQSVASGWSSMSPGERIGAIIALAVGIPTVILAAIPVWRKCRKG